MKDKLHELRKLLDPTTWPREFMVIDGELYWYVPSNEPDEECVTKTLYNGRFQ